MLAGQRAVSTSWMLELTPGPANHRGLAPEDGVTWHDWEREAQNSPHSIAGEEEGL